MTKDYWEDLYDRVLAAGGVFYVFYFVILILFGSFFLINLVLAVVARAHKSVAEHMGTKVSSCTRRLSVKCNKPIYRHYNLSLHTHSLSHSHTHTHTHTNSLSLSLSLSMLTCSLSPWTQCPFAPE